MPMRMAASTRIFSRRAMTSALASTTGGVSPAVRPRSRARTNTSGFVASTHEASTPAMTSRGEPVGSKRPVPAPPGSRKSSAIRAPRPATPASSKSPSTTASPSCVGTWATITFFVFVLWTRTTVWPSRAETSRSSMAKGPMADEQLPQLPWYSTTGARTRVAPRGGEQAAGEEDLALARGEHTRRREGDARPLVHHADACAGGQRRAQIVRAQPVVPLDAVVDGRIVEGQRDDAPVDEIRAVDPRERLHDDRAHAEVHGRDRRHLA